MVLHTFGRDLKQNPHIHCLISEGGYNDDGFYVYAKPNRCDPQNVIKYTGRYLGRSVIATSRIDKYDGELVTFYYSIKTKKNSSSDFV